MERTLAWLAEIVGSSPSHYELSSGSSASHWILGGSFLVCRTGMWIHALLSNMDFTKLRPKENASRTFFFFIKIVWPKIFAKCCTFSPNQRYNIYGHINTWRCLTLRKAQFYPVFPKSTWPQNAFFHETSSNINCALCKTHRTRW